MMGTSLILFASLELQLTLSILSFRSVGHHPPGMDGHHDGEEEAEAVLQVPNPGTGEGVSLQRLRVQTEALGIGA